MGEWRRRKTFAAQFSLPPGQAPATKRKKFCCIVAARESVGDEKTSRRSFRCRCARPRQRDARNLVVLLPRGIAAATKTKKSYDIIAVRDRGGDEKPPRHSSRCRRARPRQRKTFAAQISWPLRQAPATKRKKSCCIVAARESVGDENKEILRYYCRVELCRRRKTFAAQFSLPPHQAPATKRKKSCCIVAARNCGGDENKEILRYYCRAGECRRRKLRKLFSGQVSLHTFRYPKQASFPGSSLRNAETILKKWERGHKASTTYQLQATQEVCGFLLAGWEREARSPAWGLFMWRDRTREIWSYHGCAVCCQHDTWSGQNNISLPDKKSL